MARFVGALFMAGVVFIVGAIIFGKLFGEESMVAVFVLSLIVFFAILRSSDSSPTVRYEYHEKHSTSGGVPKVVQLLAAIAGIVAAIVAVLQLAQ
jgi:hypothetical protein